MTDKTLKRGPKGGVYYVARSGARVYVDRSSLPSGSRLISINPGDKDYGNRSSQTVASEASNWDRWAWCALFTGLAALAGLGHSWLWSFFCGAPVISCALSRP